MLDLRLPIGWFFIINAALLIGVGLVQPHAVPFLGQQVNLNLIWGGVMGSFGLLMSGLSYSERLLKQNKAIEEKEQQ
jgi:hypothetical protein